MDPITGRQTIPVQTRIALSQRGQAATKEAVDIAVYNFSTSCVEVKQKESKIRRFKWPGVLDWYRPGYHPGVTPCHPQGEPRQSQSRLSDVSCPPAKGWPSRIGGRRRRPPSPSSSPKLVLSTS